MPLSWYLNRLRTMSVPEIGFRVGQYLQKKKEKKSQIGYFPEVSLLSLPPKILPIGPLSTTNHTPILPFFGQELDYSQPINWHLDISSQRSFPLIFAKDIDIRTEHYGSAKHVWEVNRMQFLPLLAIQYRTTQEIKYLRQFQQILESWIEQNPYLLGVNWYSNIEVNVRLIVWFFCWEIIDVNAQSDQKFKDFVKNKWIPLIYLHCRYSHDNPSKYSSANNHLVSEYAGLFIAAAYWSFKESEEWRTYAQKGLEREIQCQHSAQGINKEEAAEYIQFITDFFFFAFVVGQNAGHPFSEEYAHQLEQIFEYIYQLMDMKGNIVFYGDEDDGKVCLFDPDPHVDNFHSLLTSGVVLFDKPHWKVKSHGWDTKNKILFGEEGKRIWEAQPAVPPGGKSRFYVEEGHFIMRKQQDQQEIYLHFDAAPLGFLSIAAHGHADALSFVLHVDGQPVVTEAGTYTYHTEREWRNYFIGTLAHNTIRIDHRNQAQSTGPTMWMHHYQPQVLHHTSQPHMDKVLATHNGYERLGVTHQREIILDKEKEIITITDQILLRKPKPHLLEVPLHLHPSVKVEALSTNEFLLKTPGSRDVRVKTDALLEKKLIKGQTQPMLGWFSPSFQKKEPTTVIYGKAPIDHSTTLVTTFTIVNP